MRELRHEDWRAVHSYSILDEVVRYQPWGPNTEKESRAFVAASVAAATTQPRVTYHLAIVDTPSSMVIGTASLFVRTGQQGGEGEIGYILHPDTWGRGYATEAAMLLIRFAFEELWLTRNKATCDLATLRRPGSLRRPE